MKDVQKPDHVSLTTLIGRLREGRYEVPDFQREFEWMPWDIQALMRSIFLDYYIGSLLLWKGKPENFQALACEPIYGFQGSRDPTHIVLDGQQRLTAMYYAFMAPDVPVPGRRNRFLYFIRVDKFMDEIYDEAFEYDWTRRGEKLLENQEAQFESHMFPLAVIGKGGWALPNWVQDYEKYWHRKEMRARDAGQDSDAGIAARYTENARRFGEHLKGITEEYQVAYIELDRDLEIDKVCDIFTQINSRGVRLDAFDLINALLKPKGLQLKHMWREAKERLDLPPQLRELDAEIEAVELTLRRLVIEALDDDPQRLPPHVLQKVQQRVETAAKKNPALDAERYARLVGLLEFADLRDLQDTIANKALWPHFVNLFSTKEVLAKRFDQIAELRNGIRHSRTVDEITRKEGEAALAWFREVLRL